MSKNIGDLILIPADEVIGTSSTYAKIVQVKSNSYIVLCGDDIEVEVTKIEPHEMFLGYEEESKYVAY